jgi:hypothetical protein
MRFHYFILMTLLIWGCDSTKELVKEDIILENQIDSLRVVEIDTMNYYVDTVLHNEIKQDVSPVYVEKLEKDIDREKSKELIVKYNKQNVIIEDKTVNNQSGQVNTEAGTMAYSIPEEMQVGKSYHVKLRITRDGNKVQLVEGDRSIIIYDERVKSKVIIESIRVESIMSATLLSDSDKFTITPLSTELQNIEERGYTEWQWNIKPLKGGQNYLKLIVKVRIKEDGEEFYKDITVFDKNIDVKSNPGFTVWQFIKSYWQWFMTTIIIPFVIWWWKSRKEKKKTQRKSK